MLRQVCCCCHWYWPRESWAWPSVSSFHLCVCFFLPWPWPLLPQRCLCCCFCCSGGCGGPGTGVVGAGAAGGAAGGGTFGTSASGRGVRDRCRLTSRNGCWLSNGDRRGDRRDGDRRDHSAAGGPSDPAAAACCPIVKCSASLSRKQLSGKCGKCDSSACASASNAQSARCPAQSAAATLRRFNLQHHSAKRGPHDPAQSCRALQQRILRRLAAVFLSAPLHFALERLRRHAVRRARGPPALFRSGQSKQDLFT